MRCDTEARSNDGRDEHSEIWIPLGDGLLRPDCRRVGRRLQQVEDLLRFRQRFSPLRPVTLHPHRHRFASGRRHRLSPLPGSLHRSSKRATAPGQGELGKCPLDRDDFRAESVNCHFSAGAGEFTESVGRESARAFRHSNLAGEWRPVGRATYGSIRQQWTRIPRRGDSIRQTGESRTSLHFTAVNASCASAACASSGPSPTPRLSGLGDMTSENQSLADSRTLRGRPRPAARLEPPGFGALTATCSDMHWNQATTSYSVSMMSGRKRYRRPAACFAEWLSPTTEPGGWIPEAVVFPIVVGLNVIAVLGLIATLTVRKLDRA